MQKIIIPLLQCALCHTHNLTSEIIEEDKDGDIRTGVVQCRHCSRWYPIEEYALELLPANLAYQTERQRFYQLYGKQLRLPPVIKINSSQSKSKEKKQQAHFDWYSNNGKQNYSDYAATTFWRVADKIAFDKWKTYIAPQSIVLDVGCAQGRSTFYLMDLPIEIIAFDISKRMIQEAIKCYKKGTYQARASFFVADATQIPLQSNSIDVVLGYGVIHHMEHPAKICEEIARILKPNGGMYIGSENNKTAFRIFFDMLQRIAPQWYEQAGSHPLITQRMLTRWFKSTNIRFQTRTSIYIPPHFVNILPYFLAHKAVRWTDYIGSKLPFFKDNGGLILINGVKA